MSAPVQVSTVVPPHLRVPPPYGFLLYGDFGSRSGSGVWRQATLEHEAWTTQESLDSQKAKEPVVAREIAAVEHRQRLRLLRANGLENNFAATLATILLCWLPTSSNVVEDNRFVKSIAPTDAEAVKVAQEKRQHLVRSVDVPSLGASLPPFIVPCKRLGIDSVPQDRQRAMNELRKGQGVIQASFVIEKTTFFPLAASSNSYTSTLVFCSPERMAGYGFESASRITGNFTRALEDKTVDGQLAEIRTGLVVVPLEFTFGYSPIRGKAVEQIRARLAIDPWYFNQLDDWTAKLPAEERREQEAMRLAFRRFYGTLLESPQDAAKIDEGLRRRVLTLFKRQAGAIELKERKEVRKEPNPATVKSLQHALYLRPGTDKSDVEVAMSLFGQGRGGQEVAAAAQAASRAYAARISNLASLANFKELVDLKLERAPEVQLQELVAARESLTLITDDCLLLYLPQAKFQVQGASSSLWTEMRHLGESARTLTSWLFDSQIPNNLSTQLARNATLAPEERQRLTTIFNELSQTNTAAKVWSGQVLTWIGVTNVQDEQNLRQGYIKAERLSSGFYSGAGQTRCSQCHILGDLAEAARQANKDIQAFNWSLDQLTDPPKIGEIAKRDRIIGVAVFINLSAFERDFPNQRAEDLSNTLAPVWQETYLGNALFRRLESWPGALENSQLPDFLERSAANAAASAAAGTTQDLMDVEEARPIQEAPRSRQVGATAAAAAAAAPAIPVSQPTAPVPQAPPPIQGAPVDPLATLHEQMLNLAAFSKRAHEFQHMFDAIATVDKTLEDTNRKIQADKAACFIDPRLYQ